MQEGSSLLEKKGASLLPLILSFISARDIVALSITSKHLAELIKSFDAFREHMRLGHEWGKQHPMKPQPKDMEDEEEAKDVILPPPQMPTATYPFANWPLTAHSYERNLIYNSSSFGFTGFLAPWSGESIHLQGNRLITGHGSRGGGEGCACVWRYPEMELIDIHVGHDRGISVIQQTDELAFIGAQKIDIYRYPQNLGESPAQLVKTLSVEHYNQLFDMWLHGDRLITCGNDETVRIWNWVNGSVEREIKGGKGTIVSCWVDKEKDIVWAPEGIIADSLLGYDLRSGTISHKFTAEQFVPPEGTPKDPYSFGDKVSINIVRGDNHRLAVATKEMVRIFDIRTLKPLFDIIKSSAKSIYLTPTTVFLPGDWSPTLDMYSIHTGEHIRQMRAPLRYHSYGKLFVSGDTILSAGGTDAHLSITKFTPNQTEYTCDLYDLGIPKDIFRKGLNPPPAAPTEGGLVFKPCCNNMIKLESSSGSTGEGKEKSMVLYCKEHSVSALVRKFHPRGGDEIIKETVYQCSKDGTSLEDGTKPCPKCASNAENKESA